MFSVRHAVCCASLRLAWVVRCTRPGRRARHCCRRPGCTTATAVDARRRCSLHAAPLQRRLTLGVPPCRCLPVLPRRYSIPEDPAPQLHPDDAALLEVRAWPRRRSWDFGAPLCLSVLTPFYFSVPHCISVCSLRSSTRPLELKREFKTSLRLPLSPHLSPTRSWSRGARGCAARPPRSPGCCEPSTSPPRRGCAAAVPPPPPPLPRPSGRRRRPRVSARAAGSWAGMGGWTGQCAWGGQQPGRHAGLGWPASCRHTPCCLPAHHPTISPVCLPCLAPVLPPQRRRRGTAGSRACARSSSSSRWAWAAGRRGGARTAAAARACGCACAPRPTRPRRHQRPPAPAPAPAPALPPGRQGAAGALQGPLAAAGGGAARWVGRRCAALRCAVLWLSLRVGLCGETSPPAAGGCAARWVGRLQCCAVPCRAVPRPAAAAPRQVRLCRTATCLRSSFPLHLVVLLGGIALKGGAHRCSPTRSPRRRPHGGAALHPTNPSGLIAPLFLSPSCACRPRSLPRRPHGGAALRAGHLRRRPAAGAWGGRLPGRRWAAGRAAGGAAARLRAGAHTLIAPPLAFNVRLQDVGAGGAAGACRALFAPFRDSHPSVACSSAAGRGAGGAADSRGAAAHGAGAHGRRRCEAVPCSACACPRVGCHVCHVCHACVGAGAAHALLMLHGSSCLHSR